MFRSQFTKLLVAPVLLSTLAACAPMHASYITPDISKKGDDLQKPDDLQCVLDAPDYEVRTSLDSFEMKDKFNASLGFNIAKLFMKAIGINYTASTGILGMSMSVYDPLKPRAAVVNEAGEGTFKEIKFDVNLMASLLNLDFGAYSKTPLAHLSAGAIRNTLANVSKGLQTKGNDWSTRVYDTMGEDFVLVRVGRAAGLQEGDEMKIFNVDYVWENPALPCQSALVHPFKTSVEPLAIAEVVQLEPDSAVLRIKERNSEDLIKRGAYVEVSKLVDSVGTANKVRVLARSVRIGAMTTGKIVFNQNGILKEVDLRPFVQEQLKSITDEYNLYVRH